jgi:hypothetical protein
VKRKSGASVACKRRPRRRAASKSDNLAGAPESPSPLAGLTFFDPAAPYGINPVTGKPWGKPVPMFPFTCAECHEVIQKHEDHAVTCGWWDTQGEASDVAF